MNAVHANDSRSDLVPCHKTKQVTAEAPLRRQPVSKVPKLGHFRVPKTLTFKTRLRGQPLCENGFPLGLTLKQRLRATGKLAYCGHLNQAAAEERSSLLP